MRRVYAGIGNRELPPMVAHWLASIAQALGELGYTLRSGGARGADFAFASRAPHKSILRPDDATPEAIELASRFHPRWVLCNDYARKLHGRNAQIILGRNLDELAEFVLCWAMSEERGGTALGIRIAREYGIPVVNLAHKS